jgi:hypothetical protein
LRDQVLLKSRGTFEPFVASYPKKENGVQEYKGALMFAVIAYVPPLAFSHPDPAVPVYCVVLLMVYTLA